MGCESKIKHTCGTKVMANCTFYESEVPDLSGLTNDDCLTIEETTSDIYNYLETLENSLDITGLGSECLEYDEVDGEVTIGSVLQQFEKELCLLKGEGSSNTTSTVLDISDMGLDFKCLVDPCNNSITELSQLLQLLIDKVCECCE